jgi:hypothetical protein
MIQMEATSLLCALNRARRVRECCNMRRAQIAGSAQASHPGTEQPASNALASIPCTARRLQQTRCYSVCALPQPPFPIPPCHVPIKAAHRKLRKLLALLLALSARTAGRRVTQPLPPAPLREYSCHRTGQTRASR